MTNSPGWNKQAEHISGRLSGHSVRVRATQTGLGWYFVNAPRWRAAAVGCSVPCRGALPHEANATHILHPLAGAWNQENGWLGDSSATIRMARKSSKTAAQLEWRSINPKKKKIQQSLIIIRFKKKNSLTKKMQITDRAGKIHFVCLSITRLTRKKGLIYDEEKWSTCRVKRRNIENELS